PWEISHKWYYMDPTGVPTHGPITTHEGSDNLWVVASGERIVDTDPVLTARDEEILMEWYWIAPSMLAADDGAVHVWVDGAAVGSSNELSLDGYDITDTRWNNLHLYFHANTVDADSYLRVRELYVSAK